MESLFLNNWWETDIPSKAQKEDLEMVVFTTPISFSAVLGNSGDTTLFAVKVWNYIRERMKGNDTALNK